MRSALRPARTTSLIALSGLAILVSGCAGEPDDAGDVAGPTAQPSASSGSTDSERDTEDRSDPSPSPTSAAGVSVDVMISGGEVAPSPGRTPVAVGQTVRIEVVGDQPDTVHVHGYDVEAELSPSAPAVLEFTADLPGLFEVETHGSGLLLTQLVVE